MVTSDRGPGPKSLIDSRCALSDPEPRSRSLPGESSIGSGDRERCWIPPKALKDPRLFRCVLSSRRRAPCSATSSPSSSSSPSLFSETDPDSDSDSAAPQLALNPIPTPEMPHEDPRLPPERSYEKRLVSSTAYCEKHDDRDAYKDGFAQGRERTFAAGIVVVVVIRGSGSNG